MSLHYKLKTPLSDFEIEKLQCGDVVYLSGIVITARDQAHKRISEILKRGGDLPVSLRGMAIYHAGPVVKRISDKWEVIAAGPTTSSRMAFYVEDVVCKAGVKMIIGKGGMNDKALEVFKKCKCVYCSYTGGVAVLAAMSIRRVVDVKWLDLGIPEAMWILEVEDFGPLLVTMDCRGQSLYSDIEAKVRGNKAKVLSMFS